MNRHFNKILDILEQQSALYHELKEIGKQKQQVIIDNNLDALEEITKKEQGFVKTIMSLENLRVQSLDALCAEKKLGRIETVGELMSNLNELERRQFNMSRDKLVSSISALNEVNELNARLLEQSIDYVNLSINLANSFGLEDGGYDKSATDKDIKIDKSLFDAKV